MQRRQLIQRLSAAALMPLSPLSSLTTMAASSAYSSSENQSHNSQANNVQATITALQPFDYAWLKGLARSMANSPYQAPNIDLPEAIANLNYERYQSIQFIAQQSLWAKQQSRFRVQFYHPGFLFKERIRVFEVVMGQASELTYHSSMFNLSQSGIDPKALPSNLGFSGLRINHHQDWQHDIVSFLGASYFRAVGAQRQYGLSARGLAIDIGADKPEEFPRFTHFWLERPSQEADSLLLYALLDSPSIAGAYQFVITPKGDLLMDVDAALYPRKIIDRLGIAPLTSMYLYGENDRRKAQDWRPEVHDSDGLAIVTGAGEWLWRPLQNPKQVGLYSYLDENPQGFGLLQRDRDFANYHDDGAFYERRPSLWVKPKKLDAQGFGAGSVQLLELPAPDETYDNIVAAWTPAAKPLPGQELLLSYQLTWGAHPPVEPTLAKVVATRTGLGGIVGHRRSTFLWRFVVDFAGGILPSLVARSKREGDVGVHARVWSSSGKISLISARPQFQIDGYRAMFDIEPDTGISQTIDLRLFLQFNNELLTQTWIYQWLPPNESEQRQLLKE